eukprot:CAMPEP_0184270626 /NCGR_PEP_ID=MMETSP0977-20130417/37516_1 /TAXON_ID=483370 /ORGANISM="non described non described, Strain CCMP2097" /LENGTH=61 /DNA_ID=CAMNT_0026576467 /DNA_START=1 /DNA_END=182 /DNA_ORIENTATION=+
MDALGVQRVGRLTVRQLREATGAPLRDLIQLGLTATGVRGGAHASASARRRLGLRDAVRSG